MARLHTITTEDGQTLQVNPDHVASIKQTYRCVEIYLGNGQKLTVRDYLWNNSSLRQDLHGYCC